MATRKTPTGRRPAGYALGALLACLALAGAPERALGTPAQGRSLTITMFDALYSVRVDGVLQVEERITVRFEGAWNGIYRSIPVKYRLDDGRRHEIHLDLVSVEDGRGRALRHEVDRRGALVVVKTWVPGARDATRTVVYRYEVRNGLRYFDGEEDMQPPHDELYWNVTGDEWEMPILRAQARVQLPEEVTGVRAVAYTGRYGSTEAYYEQRIIGSTVLFETTRRLNLREGFTIVVGWDSGVVARPSLVARARWFILDYLFVPLPVLVLAGMFTVWWKKGRDPELNRSIMPRYEPPEGMSPAEVGTLMDFTVDPRDLSATIIDLAVRGYVRIEEIPSRVRKRPKDHIIHILQDPAEAGGLKPHERETLEGLWSLADPEEGGRQVRVSELKRKFHRHVSAIKRNIYKRLTSRPKLFTARPEHVQGVWAGIGIVVAAFAVFIGVAASNIGLGHRLATWASLLAVPAIVIGFGLVMPARTLKGVQALNHILGLREYIDRVDRDRLKYATLDHYEKLLPFAAAMGLEEKWTEAFETILSEPPRWYVSHHPGHFHAAYFSSSLGRMTAATGTALTTAPRSASSGSGFSGGGGGGFSGGGFGGGGGGGF